MFHLGNMIEGGALTDK